MTTNTNTDSIFNWETDNLLAEDRTPEPRQNRKGGILIAAAIFVAFILTITLANSCGGSSNGEQASASVSLACEEIASNPRTDCDPEKATAETVPAPTTTPPPLQCEEGSKEVYHPDAGQACLTPMECEDWQSPRDLGPKVALTRGNLNSCQRKSATEMGVSCPATESVRWDSETNIWFCHPKTEAQLRAERCAGEPRTSAASFRRLESGSSLGSRCLMLVCDMPKHDHENDRFWSNYSCTSSWPSESIWAERHSLITETEAENMGWQSGRQTIADLNKRFRNCTATSYEKTQRITEYNGVAFWCDI